MTTTTIKATVDGTRVNDFMKAFRYGERVNDLARVDARRGSGQYDEVTWNIALDGATLFGHGRLFRRHLVDALGRGMTEAEAEEYAYKSTAAEAGIE